MAIAGIINLNEFCDKIDRLSNTQMKEGLQNACLLVENEAKKNCPVDTGKLRASIKSDVSENEGKVYTNVEYAPYIEFGTGLNALHGDGRKTPWRYQDIHGKWHYVKPENGIKPHLFMTNAMNDNRDKIIELFKNIIKETMEE